MGNLLTLNMLYSKQLSIFEHDKLISNIADHTETKLTKVAQLTGHEKIEKSPRNNRSQIT